MIDQDKYIGEDPIGHCCLNDGDFVFVNEFGIRQFICKECLANFIGKSYDYQVTLNPSCKSQEEIVQEAIKNQLEDLKRWQNS
jgi:hypothetical protein